MRTKTFAVYVILPVACVAAAIVVPPSPVRWFVTAMAIFAVSVVFYVIGKRRRPAADDGSAGPEGGQQLGRFQFSLGMLLGFVTLAVCLVAEITWQRQLENQWNDAYRVMQVSDIVEEAARKANVHFSGCDSGSGSRDRESYDYREWRTWPGVEIPGGFLNTIISSISDRLQELGAVRTGWGEGGDSSESTDSNPVYSCTEIEYRYGEATGRIVLRLVSWGGKEPGGFLFLDHTQRR
jgi:hypothetical protein